MRCQSLDLLSPANNAAYINSPRYLFRLLSHTHSNERSTFVILLPPHLLLALALLSSPPATMETAHIENVLDHAKNADFMDTSAYYNDALSGLDYLQYPPHSPFGVSSMGCEYHLGLPLFLMRVIGSDII